MLSYKYKEVNETEQRTIGESINLLPSEFQEKCPIIIGIK